MANNAETRRPRPSLLLTRPRASADRFLQGLDPALLAGLPVCISPLMEIRPLEVDADPQEAAAVIFSSANGVRLAGRGGGMPVYCVGAQTAAVAQGCGWCVRQVAETAEALLALLLAERPTGPLLHLAGLHRRGEIAERLNDGGIPTRVVALYDQVLLPLSAEAQALLAGGDPVVVPLFSPRSAQQFAAEADPSSRAVILAMSAAVAGALGAPPGWKLHIAAAPTANEMARGVEMLLRGNSLA